MAQLAGVPDLVEFALSQKGVSPYHLGSFRRMCQNPKALELISTAALASYLPDAVLTKLLKDDRLCRQLPDLKATVVERLEFVETLPPLQWELFAQTCGRRGQWLRGTVLEATRTAAAFLHTKVFREAERGIWSLLQGDLNHKLNLLANVDQPPRHPTARKVWALVRAGWPRAQIAQAIELLRDVGWTTTAVEQQHGTAAVIMRWHRQYGGSTMAARALCHASRALFSPSEEETQLAPLKKLVERTAKATEKNFERLTGRQLFLKEAMEHATLQAGRWGQARQGLATALVADPRRVVDQVSAQGQGSLRAPRAGRGQRPPCEVGRRFGAGLGAAAHRAGARQGEGRGWPAQDVLVGAAVYP